MTMRWRARWTSIGYLVAAITIVLLWGHQKTLAPFPIALTIGLFLAVIASMLFAFRCPHCHARQLRGRWDWWLMGNRCTKCWQLLDGPALPEDQLSEDFIGEMNPGLAAELRGAREAFEALVQRAPSDPEAARRLQAELSRRIESMEQGLADIRASETRDSRMERDLRESLARALAQLEWCRSLPRGDHPNPGQAV